MTAVFQIPDPESMPSARVDLTFGLRSAMRFHREQSVPGIAGVLFVRQLSWAVAALRLARAAGPATRVANAIEALSCKCAWEKAPDAYRFRGKRAFTRDRESDIWSFRELCKPAHYVQVTYRQSTVRALPEGGGLGFASGSAIRFNGMQSTGVGAQLAQALLDGVVGRGGRSVGGYLIDWLGGSVSPGERVSRDSIYMALGPDVPTTAEREIVRGRLCSVITGGICADDPRRRLRLSDFLQRTASPDWDSLLEFLEADSAGGRRHAGHLLNARAFEELMAACVSLLDRCAGLTGEEGISLRSLAGLQAVEDSIGDVRATARAYRDRANDKQMGPFPPDAIAFVDELLGSPMGGLEATIRRDGRVLRLLDSRVTRGVLYRTGFSGSAVVDPEDTEDVSDDEDRGSDASIQGAETQEAPKWPLSRLRQWESLWTDCAARRTTP